MIISIFAMTKGSIAKGTKLINLILLGHTGPDSDGPAFVKWYKTCDMTWHDILKYAIKLRCQSPCWTMFYLKGTKRELMTDVLLLLGTLVASASEHQGRWSSASNWFYTQWTVLYISLKYICDSYTCISLGMLDLIVIGQHVGRLFRLAWLISFCRYQLRILNIQSLPAWGW